MPELIRPPQGFGSKVPGLRRAYLKRCSVFIVPGTGRHLRGWHSAPIDTNYTLEGRARNRRVELTLD